MTTKQINETKTVKSLRVDIPIETWVRAEKVGFHFGEVSYILREAFTRYVERKETLKSESSETH